jgi:UPF0716 family protein affecting phage T7 exclusion
MGIILIGLLFAELLVSLKVGLIIGFGWSVVWILASAALGGILIQLSPYALMHTFNTMNLQDLSKMRNAQNAALAYLFAAILLIIPGVLTDTIGVLMLLYSFYLRLFATMRPNTKFNPKQGDDDVIDVEIIDESDRSELNP